tara:strand:+ start:3197 stop:3697 length:501 start_codon:yes stop_codon:yes gene_type:complete
MTPLKDISGLNRTIQGLEGEEKARRVKSKKDAQTAGPKNVKETQSSFDRKDKVEITSKGQEQISQKENIARYVSEIKQLPSQNSQEIANIKERVESEFYSKPEVLDKIADSLLSGYKPATNINERSETRKPASNEKLNRIREKIGTGEYDSEKILDIIADEMIKII